MTPNPYQSQPPRAFWKTAVASVPAQQIAGLWQPKYAIGTDQAVATFGSCFAQHFSRALVARGYRWINAEKAPKFADPALVAEYNYGIFSARTGNIYTAAALRQWLNWALYPAKAPTEAWARDGRSYDPFRPNIELDGFTSAEDMLRSRQATLEALARAVRNANVFVFTLGLTEAWEDAREGHVFAMCPGTVAGEFDARRHVFVNHDYPRILDDLRAAIALLRQINPEISVLLTVSPVPLTATATQDHVLTATTYSKAVLRAVAGAAAAEFAYVDYFPSYEIISAPVFGGAFYAPNMRSVLPEGVDFVMRSFFDCQARAFGTAPESPDAAPLPDEAAASAEDDLVCEEELLAAFAAQPPAKARE